MRCFLNERGHTDGRLILCGMFFAVLCKEMSQCVSAVVVMTKSENNKPFKNSAHDARNDNNRLVCLTFSSSSVRDHCENECSGHKNATWCLPHEWDL